MAENGTATFASPDDYQAGIGGESSRGASVNFIVTGGGNFKARLTWLNLHNLYVLRGSENLPSIVYVSLPPDRWWSISDQHKPLIWGGRELRFGDVVFHSRGERTHQWTPAESRWGLVSLPPDQLSACGMVLTGKKITAPLFRRVLRPPKSAASHLLRLHAKVCRLAETRHELIENTEVVRSLEQELLHALVNCLTADNIDGNLETLRHHAEIMGQVRGCLGRACRRALERARALQRYRRARANLADVLHRISGHEPPPVFSDAAGEQSALGVAARQSCTCKRCRDRPQLPIPGAGRFAVTYRTVFGEMPSATLRADGSKA